MESKLEFSKSGEQWESISKGDGSLVVAIDCEQDAAVISAGMSRELINAIQQLRKAAGLDLSDVVEVFYAEEEGVTLLEGAVNNNLSLFEAKFKGSVPVPQRYAAEWSVVLKSDTVEVGGANVAVSIRRPALAAMEITDAAKKVLGTIEPTSIRAGQTFDFTVDDRQMSVTEGKDFWLSAAAMVRSL